MKKIMLVIVGVLLLAIMPFKVQADNHLPNWEFLPNGYNYLEDENFDYNVGIYKICDKKIVLSGYNAEVHC